MKTSLMRPRHAHCANLLTGGMHGLNFTDNGIDPYTK